MKKNIFRYIENALKNNKIYSVGLVNDYPLPALPIISDIENNQFIFNKHEIISLVCICHPDIGTVNNPDTEYTIRFNSKENKIIDASINCIYVDYTKDKVINLCSLFNGTLTERPSVNTFSEKKIIELFKKQKKFELDFRNFFTQF